MKVGIIGLGLIGGSLSLDLRALGHWVWGISRREKTGHTALDRGVIDAYYQLGESLPQDTDIVVICTPIEQIIPSLSLLVKYLANQTIVTDVGSVKAPIVEAGQHLWHRFIGSHPMAGNTNSGIESAQKGLFTDRPCAVVPHPVGEINDKISALWRSVGMEVYYCDGTEHDRAVAWISHLPVIVSASLNLACNRESSTRVKILGEKLASSGFADTSRVGGGNPQLGRMMAQLNRVALLSALDHYQEVLSSLRQTIADEAWEQLEDRLKQAQEVRQTYIKSGMIAPK